MWFRFGSAWAKLRKAAEEAAVSFIPIGWLPEHGDTEVPHKRLNVVGKQLLVDSFLRAKQPPKWPQLHPTTAIAASKLGSSLHEDSHPIVL
jgi:hypothetical protein